MTTKKALMLGCGLVAALGLAAVAAAVLFLVYVSKDVVEMDFAVENPTEVKLGETFDVTVAVKNMRSGKALKVSDVDIADEYLAAFVVTGTTPPHKSSMHVPIDNSRSYTFDVTVPPGGTSKFVFHLRAEKEGIFSGDVDVCEGTRFTTKQVQTVVKAQPQGAKP